MTLRFFKILILLLIFTQACREEIVLDDDTHKKIMIVDGMITNKPGPYKIKLSFSSNVTYPKMIPVTGSKIIIYDDKGFSEVLSEVEAGEYLTSESGIQGIVGNKYRISILTSDGKEFESEYQEMKPDVGIDSVYEELIIKDVIGFQYGLPGYQFYIDTELAGSQDNYFLWTMIETYQYTANYQVYDVFNVEGSLADYKALYRCWDTQNVNYFYTAKTANLSLPKISKQPLHFVSTETRRLQERYSLLVKQYSITQNAYSYWKNVEAQISEVYFLFSTQPYDIIGNIKNINNDEEIVYGYFTVASVTEKRIFVNRPRAVFYYPESCGINFNYEDLIDAGYPVFLIKLEDERIGKVIEGCIDCSSKGGEPNKPDFWIDF